MKEFKVDDKRTLIVRMAEYKNSHNVTNPFDPPKTLGMPTGKRSKEYKKVMAMDRCIKNVLSGFNTDAAFMAAPAFVGYAMLSNVSQEALIRAGVETVADEMTRKFIQWTYDDDDGETDKEKELADLEEQAAKYKLKETFNDAALKDGYFGGCLVYIDVGELDDEEKEEPLVLDKKTFKPGSLKGFRVIEPINIYPGEYNTSDPTDEHYFNPEFWYILGKKYHASRFLYFAGNPTPVLLKPAYNFFGIPQAQLALDYVAHFVANREAAQELLNKFSLTCWKTDMTQALQGNSCSDLISRVKMFNRFKNNNGTMVLDKETEDMMQINTPLSGVRDIVDMSLSLLTAVWRIPKIKYLGEGEGGLNASSKEQMRSFYDYIMSQKEKLFTQPLETVLKIFQLNKGKDINPAIGFKYPAMWDMDDSEKAQLNKQQADRDAIYLSNGVLSQEEVRRRLSLDRNSEYTMIDVDDVPEPQAEPLKDVDEEEENETVKKAMDMAIDSAKRSWRGRMAMDDRWITIKKDHDNPEEKGRHLLLEGEGENQETPAEAMKRQWKVDITKGSNGGKESSGEKETKKEEPKEPTKEETKEPTKETPKETEKEAPKEEKDDLEKIREKVKSLKARASELKSQITEAKNEYSRNNPEVKKLEREVEDEKMKPEPDWEKVWKTNQKRRDLQDQLAEEFDKKGGPLFDELKSVNEKLDSHRADMVAVRNKDLMKEVEKFSEAYKNFTDAKTIDEANKYADMLASGGKKFTPDVNIHTANIMNKTLTGLMAKYKSPQKLDIYGVGHTGPFVIMHASNNLIEINSHYAKFTDEQMAKKFEGSDRREKAKERLAELEKKKEEAKQRGEITWQLDAEIAQTRAQTHYRCWTVQTSAENFVRDTMYHEFGHTLMFRKMVEEFTKGEYSGNEIYLSLIGKKALTATNVAKKIRTAYAKARKSGDIYEISEYGNTNYHEFFAEVFAMRESGQKLPDYIETMLKEVTGQ